MYISDRKGHSNARLGVQHVVMRPPSLDLRKGNETGLDEGRKGTSAHGERRNGMI